MPLQKRANVVEKLPPFVVTGHRETAQDVGDVVSFHVDSFLMIYNLRTQDEIRYKLLSTKFAGMTFRFGTKTNRWWLWSHLILTTDL